MLALMPAPCFPLDDLPSHRAGVWLAALVALVLAAYSNTLQAPFVYDDRLAIPENPTIRGLWPIGDVLMPQAQGGLTVSGRPILNLSFAINYAISGTHVWSYHVFNILVHAGAALLLFGTIRRTVNASRCDSLAPAPAAPGGTSLAGTAAALWALHPLHTQAVTYTVQRAESLMGFLFLLTLYGFVRHVHRPAGTGSIWLWVSVTACVLGMGTKEVMATAPLLVLLYDRTFVTGSFREALSRRRSYYAALAASWLVLGALVWSTGGNRGGTVGLNVGIPLWAYPMTQFKALATYLARAFWPHPLVFEHGTFWVRTAADILPYAAVVIPLLVGTILCLRRAPALGFCGAWLFLILAPTSLAPGTIQMIVEHRMYLPLAAVTTMVAAIAHRRAPRKAPIALAAAAVAFGVLSYARNHDYRSHLALWTDTVAKRPGNPRAHDGLAEAYEELGRLDQALEHRRRTVELQPDESTYHYNLAMALSASGDTEGAVRHYRRSLDLAPDEPRTHNNLAILLGKLGNDAGALQHYGEVVRLRPQEALYHYNHGIALMRAGKTADAANSFTYAIRLREDYADAHFNLGTALVRLGRPGEALASYASAVRLNPGEIEYRNTYAGALLLTQRPADALAEFNRVLSVQPGSIEALFGAGNALAAMRRHDEAIAHYQSVIRHAPNHSNAHFKLANALLDLDQPARAIEHYQAALRIAPTDPEAHHNLGVAHARLEQWADARQRFETALRLKPDYPDARRHLDQLKALIGP